MRANARENLKLTTPSRLYLLQLNGKVLFAQFVVMGFIYRLQEFFQTFAAKNVERLAPVLSLRRPLHSKQEVRQTATMI